MVRHVKKYWRCGRFCRVKLALALIGWYLYRVARAVWRVVKAVLVGLAFVGILFLTVSVAADIYWTLFPPDPHVYVAAVNRLRDERGVVWLKYSDAISARAQRGADAFTAGHVMGLVGAGCGEAVVLAVPFPLWPGGPGGYVAWEIERSPEHYWIVTDPRYRYVGVGQRWFLIGAKVVIQVCQTDG